MRTAYIVIGSRQTWAGETLFNICIIIIHTGNTSEIDLVFLMYCVTLCLLPINFCPSWAFSVGYGFYFLLNSCRSNRLSAGMGWRDAFILYFVFLYPYYPHRKHVRDWPGVSDVLRHVMFTS